MCYASEVIQAILHDGSFATKWAKGDAPLFSCCEDAFLTYNLYLFGLHSILFWALRNIDFLIPLSLLH